MSSTNQVTKLRKPDKKRIAVFFDTNFLYTKDKRFLFSKFFHDFSRRYSTAIDFGLFVPDTVMMELEFQTFSEARDATRMIEKSIEFLNRVGSTSIESRHLGGVETNVKLTVDSIGSCIGKTFAQAIKENGLQVIPLPHKELDVREIQQMSINRGGVFETVRTTVDGKEVDVGEKGFRDHLIFKTIESHFKTVAGYEAYVILTQDKKLGTELAKIKAPHGLKLEILNSIEAVFSYFNIIQSTKDKEWVNQLLPLATLHFFNYQEKTGAWFSPVRDKLLAKFEKQMIEKVPRPKLFEIHVDPWQFDSAQFTISNAQFESAGASVFSWSNIVEYTKKFFRRPAMFPNLGQLNSISGTDSPLSMSLSGVSESLYSSPYNYPVIAASEEAEVKMKFQIKWQATVSTEAEFSEFSVVDMKLIDEGE